jgi:hypothetical protein
MNSNAAPTEPHSKAQDHPPKGNTSQSSSFIHTIHPHELLDNFDTIVVASEVEGLMIDQK